MKLWWAFFPSTSLLHWQQRSILSLCCVEWVYDYGMSKKWWMRYFIGIDSRTQKTHEKWPRERSGLEAVSRQRQATTLCLFQSNLSCYNMKGDFVLETFSFALIRCWKPATSSQKRKASLSSQESVVWMNIHLHTLDNASRKHIAYVRRAVEVVNGWRALGTMEKLVAVLLLPSLFVSRNAAAECVSTSSRKGKIIVNDWISTLVRLVLLLPVVDCRRGMQSWRECDTDFPCRFVVLPVQLRMTIPTNTFTCVPDERKESGYG
jgi:hypothetical protein